MKISKSKQELARIIRENGGWKNSNAEWAAQDGSNGQVSFFKNEKPTYSKTEKEWMAFGDSVHCYGSRIEGCKVIKNFHQTILSREEYFHLYPDPDADGWIEWLRDELPVEEGVIIDVKYSDGDELHAAPCGVYTENMTSIRGECASAEFFGRGDGSFIHIIAYRLHKPEQAKSEFCESVMRSIPEPTAKPTIEQLAADYRDAKDYAERKQQEADDAKADADEKLRVLAIAGEALGLLVSPITTKQEPELVITDWRDLRVGDVIEVTGSSNEGWGRVKGKELTIKVVRSDGASTGEWLVRDNTEFRIIRRP